MLYQFKNKRNDQNVNALVWFHCSCIESFTKNTRESLGIGDFSLSMEVCASSLKIKAAVLYTSNEKGKKSTTQIVISIIFQE